VVLALALVLTVAGCAGSDSSDSAGTTGATGTVLGQNPAAGDFYQPPDPLPKGKPGEIIRSQPLANPPAGSQGWLVLYHSTGLDGEDIAVSGMIFAPAAGSPGSTAPRAGDRPIVSWAHPTTGVADTCAPSVLSDGPTLIAGLEAFLDAGYVVAATDYEGLGTPGLHPYLIGVSEGRSTLDAARAARNLQETGAGTQLFVWGHSQGGQGALFAGQLASTYAPELELKGAAAAAPAGELAAVFDLDLNTVDGIALGGWAMNAFYEIYKGSNPDMSLDQMLTAEGQAALPQLETLCDVIPDQYAQITAIATPLIGKFYATTDPDSVPPWNTLLQENSPGATKTPAPIFIAQDTADEVVPASTTDTLVKDLCSIGNTVNYKTYQGLSHTVIGFESAPDVLAWMQSILAGQAAPNTCS
jgi:acetyl esterase/lipase